MWNSTIQLWKTKICALANIFFKMLKEDSQSLVHTMSSILFNNHSIGFVIATYPLIYRGIHSFLIKYNHIYQDMPTTLRLSQVLFSLISNLLSSTIKVHLVCDSDVDSLHSQPSSLTYLIYKIHQISASFILFSI
jgi:hypothetical protein